MALPSSLSLRAIADSSQIVAADHRNNYSDIQTGFNALLTYLSATAAVPSGALLDYAAAAAPTGWLLCDGASYLRTDYVALFAAIGVLYGSADGTHFNVPDLRGRVSVGYAVSGGHTDVATLGLNDGVAVANRRAKHKHTPHAHTYSGATGTINLGGSGVDLTTPQSLLAGTTNSVDGGSGNANDSLDAPSYIVVNKIIKT